MDDLDNILGKLGEAPVHPRLEGMDMRLVARIAADRRDRDLPLGASLLMIGAALGVGLVSGQATARQAAPQTVELNAGLDLAPSTRLVTAG